MLGQSTRDPFNKVFGKPTWQPGILSDEISKGPRLELPAREYVLFRGGVAELADPEWVARSPWRDREQEEHGFPPSAQAPALVWPEDRAWVLVSEVDYDSTIVAGERRARQGAGRRPAPRGGGHPGRRRPLVGRR